MPATMSYLERGRDKRVDPDRVLPGARSVVACALSYYQGPSAIGPDGVARYAWGDDYHAVMESRLRALAETIARLAPGSTARAYVDTGPLLERDLAARAGLGWIGKNTMLLHPGLGSFFFIGTILTTAELEPDAPLADRCGTCTRCLDACPTDAFVGPVRSRRPPLHRVPDDRAPGADRGGAPPRSRDLGLRLRRLPGRLSLEPACGGHRGRGRVQGPRRTRRSPRS